MARKKIDPNHEQWMRIVNDYRNAGRKWPAAAMDIATWADGQGYRFNLRKKLLSLCAKEISKAMREECYTDPQGRRVRLLHAAKVTKKNECGKEEQLVLWEDIRTGTRDHMEMAFQQRREQIVGDCKQLRTDVDSFNDNRKLAVPIQIYFDFTEDVEEAMMPEEYVPRQSVS